MLVPELGLGLALVVAAEVVDVVAFAGAAEKSKNIRKDRVQVRYVSKYERAQKGLAQSLSMASPTFDTITS